MKKQLFLLVLLITSVFFSNKIIAQHSAFYDDIAKVIYVKFDPTHLNLGTAYVDISLREGKPILFGIKIGIYNGPDYVTIQPDPDRGDFVPNGIIRLEFLPWKWEQEGKPSTANIEIISTDGDDREVHRYTVKIIEG